MDRLSLQNITKNEEEPDNNERYEVKKIWDHKFEKGSMYFFVEWMEGEKSWWHIDCFDKHYIGLYFDTKLNHKIQCLKKSQSIIKDQNKKIEQLEQQLKQENIIQSGQSTKQIQMKEITFVRGVRFQNTKIKGKQNDEENQNQKRLECLIITQTQERWEPLHRIFRNHEQTKATILYMRELLQDVQSLIKFEK